MTRTITNPADTCSAEFQGLNPYTEYDINVDAELTTPDITVRSDNVTCCTKGTPQLYDSQPGYAVRDCRSFSSGCIEIIPKCENSTETSLNISYELKLNGSFLVSEYIKVRYLLWTLCSSGTNFLRCLFRMLSRFFSR